jgi:hypothetical protein
MPEKSGVKGTPDDDDDDDDDDDEVPPPPTEENLFWDAWGTSNAGYGMHRSHLHARGCNSTLVHMDLRTG